MFNELLKNVMQLGIITEDDVRRLTSIELMMLIIERINGLLNYLNSYVESNDNRITELDRKYKEITDNILNNVDDMTIEQLNAWLSDGTLEELINENVFTDINERINVEKSRIDALTKLSEGSTTGDAELIDGRIGVTGYTYTNIGSAIRQQISTVNHHIDEVSKDLINFVEVPFTNRNGVGFDKNNETNKVVDYPASNIKSVVIDVKEHETYLVKTTIGSNWRGIMYSDAENNFIGEALRQNEWLTFSDFVVVIPSGCTKLMINCSSANEVNLHRKVYEPAVSIGVVNAKLSGMNSKLGTTMKTINRLGYRGNGGNENTMYAFKEAIKKGFNILLCDVRFTSDNVGVSLHDATINRTARNTDGSEISKTTNIADITLAQANQYDYGISGGVSEVGIVTVEMLIKLCKMTNCELYLEYKEGSFAQYDELMKMIDRYDMIGHTTLTAGFSILKRYGAMYPDLRLGLNSSYSEENMVELGKLKTDKNEVFLFGWHTDNLTLDQIDVMNANQVKYEFGTVNNVDTLIELMNSPMIFASRVESDSLIVEEELFKRMME